VSAKLLDVEASLKGLKDFQCRTVEYVFNRMYSDHKPARRFLVADEVGLGKTLVARGIVAKVVERLQNMGKKRIDILYI
jgi:Cdc6-like AAA superfamily ATPase